MILTRGRRESASPAALAVRLRAFFAAALP